MAMLDSIKGPDGQIKKPILISLVGAGGLLAYLALKGGSGSTTSTGQSSALTPDLTGLQTALDNLLANQGSGQGGSGGGVAIPPTGTVTAPGFPTPGAVSLPTLAVAQPSVPQAPGSSGSGGGGGGGTGQVLQSIAKAPTVYGGLAVAAPTPVTKVSTGVITPFIAALPIGSTIKPGVTTVATPSGGVRMVSTGVSPIAGAMYEGKATVAAKPYVAPKPVAKVVSTGATPKKAALYEGRTIVAAKPYVAPKPVAKVVAKVAPKPVYHAPAPLAKPKSNATPTRL